MPTPPVLLGLHDIVTEFDGLICDVWGVIHNGERAFPAALDCLARLRAQGTAVVLVSNTPRPHWPILDQLKGFGVDHRHFDHLVTAGDLARDALLRLSGEPRCLHIGHERDLPLYEGVAVRQVAAVEDADLIVCTGPENEDSDTVEDYRGRLASAAARRAPFYCANPDLIVHRGDEVLLCAGAIAKVYEEMGGPVQYFGKPHGGIYERARGLIDTERGAAVPRSRLLAIGDGLITDVAGAQAQGIPIVFIVSGIHRDEFMNGAAFSDRLKADWIMNVLKW